jgi:hypothetical protein
MTRREGTQGSRFPKVNVEHTGSPSHYLLSRDVSLLREEDISILDFGHHIGMPLNLLMMNV